MRLISAAPRDLAANTRSMATTGRPVDQDGFERGGRFAVGERQRVREVGALPQDVQLIGFGDEDDGGQDAHCIGAGRADSASFDDPRAGA